jgi:hypothetical protein
MLVVCMQAHGQNENFASDRPGLSDAPDLIKRGSWQIESGVDLSDYNHYQVWQLSTNTLRYAISKRLEARMDFGIQYDRQQKVYGAASPGFGLKTLVTDQLKWLPKTAFIIEFYPPSFSSAQQPAGLAMELCFSHNLNSGNAVYYNVGYSWISLQATGTFNALLGYTYAVTKQLNVFAETYVYKRENIRLNIVSDIGATFQLNRKLQFDLAFGLDLVRPRGNQYIDGGISYNF